MSGCDQWQNCEEHACYVNDAVEIEHGSCESDHQHDEHVMTCESFLEDPCLSPCDVENDNDCSFIFDDIDDEEFLSIDCSNASLKFIEHQHDDDKKHFARKRLEERNHVDVCHMKIVGCHATRCELWCMLLGVCSSITNLNMFCLVV